MMTTPHLGERGVHPVVASAARELLNKSENERSGVLSTAMSFLGLYRDPVVATVTRRCDWRIRDLVESERPGDALPRRAAVRHQPHQAAHPADPQPDRPAADRRAGLEATPAPPAADARRVPGAWAGSISSRARSPSWRATASRAFLIAQSLNQIEKAYGQNNSILDNCHVRVSFATNDERTAKRVSDALGTATEMRAMKNYAGHRLSPWLGHLMVSRQETARPLLTPGEVMQLPPDDELVLVSGCPSDPRQEGALLRGPAVEGAHPAAAQHRALPSRLAGSASAPRDSRTRGDWPNAIVASPASEPMTRPMAASGVSRNCPSTRRSRRTPRKPGSGVRARSTTSRTTRRSAFAIIAAQVRDASRARRRSIPATTSGCECSMRTKHTFRLPPELASKLADYAARKGVPQALVVEAALASYLSPDGADRLEAALARRLDRMTRRSSGSNATSASRTRRWRCSCASG